MGNGSNERKFPWREEEERITFVNFVKVMAAGILGAFVVFLYIFY